jgi:membrane-associated phospholipid phosphatase
VNERRSTAITRAPLLVAGLATLLFVAITALVATNALTAVDTRGILAVRAFASPMATTIMQAASRIAHGRVSVPFALLVAGVLYAKGARRSTLLYVLACAVGEILMLTIKEIVHHHRPVGISPKLTDAGWYSFPSGHTMLGVIIFGLAVFFLADGAGRTARLLAWTGVSVLVVLIALSRVYLGAHWPSDVIGAALAGIAWSAGVVLIARSSLLHSGIRAHTDGHRPPAHAG